MIIRGSPSDTPRRVDVNLLMIMGRPAGGARRPPTDQLHLAMTPCSRTAQVPATTSRYGP